MTSAKQKKRKRWGKRFIDKRDWPTYNEQLVKRGEFWLDCSFVEHWHEELEQMNAGKQGRPYQFPNSLIELQAMWHAKGFDFRATKGITRDLMRMGRLPAYNDYSTICRRVNALEFQLALPEGKDLTIFADGCGLQVVEGGEYMREKYGKKNRRWVQVIIWGDARTHEPISYEINLVQESELASAKRQFVALKEQGVSIAAAGGDGSYDELELWNSLAIQGISPVIKPDKNARTDSESSMRNANVRLREQIGYEAWSCFRGYGKRWPATEGVFSAVKRVFGEQIHARTEQGMQQEAACKIWAYQRIKRYGEA